MLAKNHVPFSLAVWALAAPYMGVSTTTALFAAPLVAVAALLPDIDHPNSVLGQKLPGVSHLIRLVLGHRGGTHCLLAVIGWVALLMHFGSTSSIAGTPFLSSAILALGFGYLSHIAADGLTKSGVPLLWPYKRNFRLPIAFTTGSWVEYVVAWGFVAYASLVFARTTGITT